jgi:peptide chain release factor
MPFPVDLPPDLLALADELKLKPEDVEENFIRGGGHGGQKINKTSSTVQLRHELSGVEVRMQRFREQSKNRLEAWKMLILKLKEKEKGDESRIAQEAFKVRKQKQRRSRRAKEKMLDEKHHRGTVKEARQDAWEQWREKGV